jgi:phospholipid/cholesterol/gamma-HCH transport system substrate-binding protein
MKKLLARIPAKLKLFATMGVIGALIVAGLVVWVTSGPSETTITAEFATASGLYVGNQVRILGMPVGSVTSITPGPSYVRVVMQVPSSTAIPANAQALIMAPQVVNDRYIQLNPAYNGGPKMQSGTVISDFIDSTAHAFGPNGAALHSTLDSLGTALGALSSQGPQLTDLFDNLGNLSKVASEYTGTYQSFANNLAAVSTDLSSDDSDLGSALANLQQALGQLAEFIRTNGSALGSSVSNLEAFAGAVASKQQQLAQVFGNLPTALNNITAAYDPTAPGGPALRSRFDPMGGSQAFSKSVCGNALLRLLLLSVDASQDTIKTTDLGCGVSGLLAALPTPPGASTGPNLSISAIVGSQP